MEECRLPLWTAVEQGYRGAIDERAVSVLPGALGTPRHPRRRGQHSLTRLVRPLSSPLLPSPPFLVLNPRNPRDRPSLLPPTLEAWYLHLALLLSLISYFTSATAVVHAFTSYLGIKCFSLPPSSPAARAKFSPLPSAEQQEQTKTSTAGRQFGRLGVELKELMGVEGRKRSNTSEREEGVGGAEGGGQEGRRVARVG